MSGEAATEPTREQKEAAERTGARKAALDTRMRVTYLLLFAACVLWWIVSFPVLYYVSWHDGVCTRAGRDARPILVCVELVLAVWFALLFVILAPCTSPSAAHHRCLWWAEAAVLSAMVFLALVTATLDVGGPCRRSSSGLYALGQAFCVAVFVSAGTHFGVRLLAAVAERVACLPDEVAAVVRRV